VKLRILTCGLAATHESFTILTGLNETTSISDFDALALDPAGLLGRPVSSEDFTRKQQELRDLIHAKGGAVLFLMRASVFIQTSNRHENHYSLLQGVSEHIPNLMGPSVRVGEGSLVNLTRSAGGASSEYFRILKQRLRFTSYLESSQPLLNRLNGKIFATDSVGHAIAVEFAIGQGILCFVPIPHNVTGEQVGAAIANTIAFHFKKPFDIDVPPWCREISVPGAGAHDERIAVLERSKEDIATEISVLKDKKNELLNFKRLLYGYGKAVLEPAVRSAFRLFGFEVPEPQDYRGEWDVQLNDAATNRTAIGEVEGSKGLIDVDKYRQLNDYVDAETLEGRNHKGLLIGNGFRETDLNAAERQAQFSEHALRGAARNQFCLVPTSGLFKAVCACLRAPDDENLRIRIRDSFFETVGVWTFME
jgi:hypothetical protein